MTAGPGPGGRRCGCMTLLVPHTWAAGRRCLPTRTRTPALDPQATETLSESCQHEDVREASWAAPALLRGVQEARGAWADSQQGPHQEHPKQPPGRVGGPRASSWAQDAQDGCAVCLQSDPRTFWRVSPASRCHPSPRSEGSSPRACTCPRRHRDERLLPRPQVGRQSRG